MQRIKTDIKEIAGLMEDNDRMGEYYLDTEAIPQNNAVG